MKFIIVRLLDDGETHFVAHGSNRRSVRWTTDQARAIRFSTEENAKNSGYYLEGLFNMQVWQVKE